MNVPKFLAHDLPLYAGIMSDLFPGRSKPVIDYGDFRVSAFAAKRCACKLCLSSRRGNRAVRDGSCAPLDDGCWPSGRCQIVKLPRALFGTNVLKARGIEAEYEPVFKYYMNPKAITLGQLYGQFDPNARVAGWDHLRNLRKCVAAANDDNKWLMFDGPVDAIWIENMNTVMDDNKKLCLNSGG